MTTPGVVPRYATVEDVREALAVGPDVDEDTFAANAAGLDDDRLIERINKGAADVDASLWPAYETPFTEPAPTLIVELTTALAVYFATVTYGEDDPLAEDHPIRQNYQWARQRMLDITSSPPRAGIPGVQRVTRSAVDYGQQSGGNRAGRPRNPHRVLFGADTVDPRPPYAPVDRPWLAW